MLQQDNLQFVLLPASVLRESKENKVDPLCTAENAPDVLNSISSNFISVSGTNLFRCYCNCKASLELNWNGQICT